MPQITLIFALKYRPTMKTYDIAAVCAHRSEGPL